MIVNPEPYEQPPCCEKYKRMRAENDKLKTDIESMKQLVWAALDGIYGANRGETAPIDNMTADRKIACNELLAYLASINE
jgi:hypothetical protein